MRQVLLIGGSKKKTAQMTKTTAVVFYNNHDFLKYLGSCVFVQTHSFYYNKNTTQLNTRKTQLCTEKNAQPSTWHTQLLMSLVGTSK